jgi:hypothetical protein
LTISLETAEGGPAESGSAEGVPAEGGPVEGGSTIDGGLTGVMAVMSLTVAVSAIMDVPLLTLGSNISLSCPMYKGLIGLTQSHVIPNAVYSKLLLVQEHHQPRQRPEHMASFCPYLLSSAPGENRCHQNPRKLVGGIYPDAKLDRTQSGFDFQVEKQR